MIHPNIASEQQRPGLSRFQILFETGGNEPWALILRSTAHGHLPHPDRERTGEREGAAGAAPAGGERPGGGLGATAGSLGSGRAAVASPETVLRGGTTWWPCGSELSSGCSSVASR